MNTPDTTSLHLLLEREEAERDAAALTLRQAQDHLQRLQLQMTQFAEHNLQRQRHRLVEAEKRVAAIGKLISRRVETHQRAEQRRDQKHTDEAAQRAAWLSRQSHAVPALG
jgi:flagellar FliJ protein